MKKISYNYLMVIIIFMLIVGSFSYNVSSATTDKSLSVNKIVLVTHKDVHELYGFDGDYPIYNNEGLTSFNMPFIIEYKDKDFSLTSNDLKGSFLKRNSNFDERFKDLYFEVIDFNGKYAFINYHVDVKASTECFSVDFIPELYGKKYVEYAWWNSSYMNKKMFTINHDLIDSNLTNFPVLVLIDSDTYNKTNDGNSIRFVDSNETNEFNFEFDVNSSTSNTSIWVNVTSVSSVEDTIFYMYYNNSNVTNAENSSGTWDDYYEFVCHMNDNTTDTILASDDNAYEGNKLGVDEPIVNNSGIVGNCQTFDDSDDVIEVDDNVNLDLDFDDGGYSFWRYNTSANAGTHFFLNKGDSAGNDNQFTFYIYDNKLRAYLRNTASKYTISQSNVLADGEWNYIHVTVDRDVSTGMKIYVDGSELESYFQQDDITSESGSIDGNDNFHLGNRVDHAYPMAGSLDEVRMTKGVVRSPAWIKAEYHNIANYSGFMTEGSEETEPVVYDESGLVLSGQVILLILIIVFTALGFAVRENILGMSSFIIAYILGLAYLGSYSIQNYQTELFISIHLFLILACYRMILKIYSYITD